MDIEIDKSDESEDKASADPIKLISDWAKWVITLETGIILAIGATVRGEDGPPSSWAVKFFAVIAVACFFISIVAAALLLLALPAIAEYWRKGDDIWTAQDRVISYYLKIQLTIERLAIAEGFGFVAGLFFFILSITVLTFTVEPDKKHLPNSTEPTNIQSKTPRSARA